MWRMLNKWHDFLISSALTLAILAVFWQVRHHEFVGFDDDDYIYDNNHVKAGLTREGIVYAFTGEVVSHWHPLTILSLMLDCKLYGLDAGSHHFINVLFHIANTILLFLILNHMTGGLWSSAFVAAAFALHPLHVESVAWASERKDMLSTFFWMLTMAAYLGYVRHPGTSRYLLTLLTFVLGLMAKSMLVTLPFVLLLLDYWPLGRFQFVQATADTDRKTDEPSITPSQWSIVFRLVREKVPFFVLSAIISVVIFVIHNNSGIMKTAAEYPLIYRIENALIAYVAYIEKMFWPSHLAIFYPHLRESLPVWQIVASGFLLVCITVLVIWKIRQHPYLAVGWLWYLGTLVPVIGLVQCGLHSMADRYTYISLTGLFIIIAWGIPDIFARLHHRKAILSLSAAVVLSSSGVTAWFQVKHWRNSMTLYRHAATVIENNWWAHNNLASELQKQGKIDEAIMEWEKVVQLQPRLPAANLGLGVALLNRGKYDDAIKHFDEFLREAPRSADGYHLLGLAYHRQGKYDWAIKNYNEALRLSPNNPDIINHLGMTLDKQGKTEQAIGEWEDVLKLEPTHADAHFNLGLAMAWQKKYERAIEHFNEALRTRPDWAEAYYYLGLAYARQGKYEQAIQNYKEVLQLEPDSVDPMNRLARILATAEDTKVQNPAGAVRLAEWACELTKYEQPELLDTLAAAYAAAGKFSEAIETAEKAIRLAENAGQKELAQEIQNHLQLYKASQPYRQLPPVQDNVVR